jgi:ATP-binding cassette subfamily F protein 3
MVSLNQVSVQFNGEFLFNGISFLVNPRDRIGLVGKNGAGKSTMLKIIAGKQQPESGNVSFPQGTTIGYLSQDIKPAKGRSVFDECYSALAELTHLEERVEFYGNELATRTDYESDAYMEIIEKFNDCNERFMILGGHTAAAEVEKVLMGLGFLRTDFIRPIEEFSGGWQMRVELAKILVQHPDVLLLDEPTNHLDILSIEWLEQFLKDHNGSVILVSHDRAFLDNITNRTIEITLGRINDYKVPYSKYVEQRAERRALQMASFENQQKMIADTERFIERFRAKASKATQVQSRIKQLDKVERLEVEEEDNASLRFRFPPAPRAGKVVVHAVGISKSYGQKQILSKIDLMLDRGEKVAFLGKNGEGKTTFAKIIVGEVANDGGHLEKVHNVALGYYAQDQAETLDPERTVFETLDDVAVGDVRKRVRDILGSFLFSGESVDKKVKVLSGGERARLAMAKLLLEPKNLLVLDEPTNHLDMRSKDILKQALIKYDGALIIVSHDRDFLKGMTDKVYEFKDKKIKETIGDVYDFLRKQNIESLDQLSAVKKTEAAKPAPKKEEPTVNQQERKELEKKHKALTRNAELLEAEIATLEKEIANLDEIMLDPVLSREAMKDGDIFARYQAKQAELDAKMKAWEAAQAEIEALGV